MDVGERSLAGSRGIGRVRRLLGEVSAMLEEAYSIASSYGVVVGRVSRYSDVMVDEEGLVEMEVDPEVYYSMPGAPFHRVGDYLAIVEPKTRRLVLVRVKAIRRRDELAAIGIQPPVSSYGYSPQPQGLLTTTRIVGRLLLEAGIDWGEEPHPATISIEPQSPIIDPKPEVLMRLLAIDFRDGPILGALSTPSGVVKDGRIPVRLPYRSMLQHVLIIGTTGSGKTTLLKNIVASIYSDYSEERPSVVILDMNQEFIQLPLPPAGQERGQGYYRASAEADAARRVYGGVRPPPGIISLVPVVKDILVPLLAEHSSLEQAMERAALEYYESTLTPLTGRRPEAAKCVRRGSRTFMCSVDPPSSILVFVPYTVNTMELGSDKMSSLMPELTTQALDLLKKVREGYRRSTGSPMYPPLFVLLGALAAYIQLNAHSRRGQEREVEEERVVEAAWRAAGDHIIAEPPIQYDVRIEGINSSFMESVLEVYRGLVEARPHDETVKALYRRLLSLAHTGIVDVALSLGSPGAGDGVRVLEEASWDHVLGEAESRGFPVVVDLKWLTEASTLGVDAPRIAAYRLLESLISYKYGLWMRRKASSRTIIVIDEAHQFFPQEKGSREEQEAIRHVASMIAKLARLGRARGVGLVFSTHTPRDLHDIIIQLTNTKIILRTDPHHAEKLDLPKEVREVIPRVPDRMMAVLSHILRGGYVFAQTATPLTLHYDISFSPAPQDSKT